MSSTLTNLTAATTWSGTDLFYALVGGNSRKIAAAKFLVAETSSSLSMQDSTTAQTFYVYRTFTDSSNYERLALQSGSGYFEVAAQTAGTGTDNIDLRLTPAGTTSSVTITSAGNDQFKITGTDAAGYSNFHMIGTGHTYQIGVGNASETGNSVANKFFVYDRDNSKMRLVIDTTGQIKLASNETIAGGGSAAQSLVFSTSNIGIYAGSGGPTVSAGQGSIYLRTDGSTGATRMYVNTSSGSGTTWTNITAAG